MKRVGIFFLVAACSVQQDSARSQRSAELVSSDLVIAEIYGGGGNSGAVFKNDYVVLFNRGAVAASLDGLQLSYASESGPFGTSTVNLPNVSVPSGGSYLVSMGSGGSAGAALPTADTIASVNMSASAGKLALAKRSGGLSASCGTSAKPCDPATWVDFVGWGGNPSQFEGHKAKTASNTTALRRGDGGCAENGDNADDFQLISPSAPRSSMTALAPCSLTDLASSDLSNTIDMNAVDLSSADLGPSFALLNEVRWNPGGSDSAEEFIELIGQGVLPANTYLFSVDGDAGSLARINYAKNVSGLQFGANGLLLLLGTNASFPGIANETTRVTDAALNGTPLQNGTESIVLVQASAPLTYTVGTTLYTSLSGLTMLDSISASDGVGTSYGAALTACPVGQAKPAHAALRIIEDARANTTAAWYAGLSVGAPDFLGLDRVSECSAGPATYALSPGRANDDLPIAPPDLAGGSVDLLSAHDSGTAHDLGRDLATQRDFSVDASSPRDLSALTLQDAASDLSENYARRSGCDLSGGHTAPSPLSFIAIGLIALVLWRRRSDRSAREQLR